MLQEKKTTAGFDGFIDTIVHVIKKKNTRKPSSLFTTVGIGMNGHIGFNEDVSFDNYSHVIDLDDTTLSVGQKYFKTAVSLQKGITLGLRHLQESKKVLLQTV